MGLEFGAVAPCRECNGVGSVKHRADPAAEKERARERARGHDVPPPPSMDLCPRCHGAGFLPIADVDRSAPPDELPF